MMEEATLGQIDMARNISQFLLPKLYSKAFGKEFTQDKLVSLFIVFQLGKAAIQLRSYLREKPPRAQQEAPQPQPEIMTLLERVRDKAYFQKGREQGYSERLRSTGKIVPIDNLFQVPPPLRKQSSSRARRLAALLEILRPLVYLALLRVYGLKSYWPYLVSLALDLLRIYLERSAQSFTKEDVLRLQSTNSVNMPKYLFRSPFYQSVLKPRVIERVLGRFMSEKNFLRRVIVFLLDTRSSLCFVV